MRISSEDIKALLGIDNISDINPNSLIEFYTKEVDVKSTRDVFKLLYQGTDNRYRGYVCEYIISGNYDGSTDFIINNEVMLPDGNVIKVNMLTKSFFAKDILEVGEILDGMRVKQVVETGRLTDELLTEMERFNI